MPFAPLPLKPTISFDTFEKIDIRVGKIQKVEDIPNSDKLVRLIVNFGDFTRTILVGLKRSATISTRSRTNRRFL